VVGDSMLPKISVITPSFNQAAYLEKTIGSVIGQNYPHLEHIIVDGGSTDASVSIIRGHESELAWWVSETDRGQSHAINKGFSRSTGEILCWLNSDDFLADGALSVVGRVFARNPGIAAIVGHCIALDVRSGDQCFLQGEFKSRLRLLSPAAPYRMHQPSIFWRREVYERVGPLDESMHIIMDFDYWCRIADHYAFVNVDEVLSYCHRHEQAKTADGHVGYHAARRDYIRERRARLNPADRLRLAAMEIADRSYDGIKRIERSMRWRRRSRKRQDPSGQL